jgi:hypothetical protein
MPAATAAASLPPSSPPHLPKWTPKAARAQWRKIADQLRPKLPKLASFMDQTEADVLAYMAYMDFPAAHRRKLHSTNPRERLNGEAFPASRWLRLKNAVRLAVQHRASVYCLAKTRGSSPTAMAWPLPFRARRSRLVGGNTGRDTQAVAIQ